MSTRISERATAVRERLATAFPFDLGYGSFRVRTARPRKNQPRVIVVEWVVHPFEAQVADALGDLMGDDVTFDRIQMWSCGIRHANSMEAWKAHEGNHWLAYPDNGYGECDYQSDMELPEDIEEELRAGGEDFTSECVPGNYTPCPTCGGGARYIPNLSGRRTFANLRYEPCPDCVRLDNDRHPFPGILDLDNPDHLAFYESVLGDARAKAAAEVRRADTKREKALAQPAATAKPLWRELPSRAGGMLNNIPVPEVPPGCDRLNHAEDPERRVRCGQSAKFFDLNTGLRVCTRHRSAKG